MQFLIQEVSVNMVSTHGMLVSDCSEEKGAEVGDLLGRTPLTIDDSSRPSMAVGPLVDLDLCHPGPPASAPPAPHTPDPSVSATAAAAQVGHPEIMVNIVPQPYTALLDTGCSDSMIRTDIANLIDPTSILERSNMRFKIDMAGPI